jgi:hypothetical protein
VQEWFPRDCRVSRTPRQGGIYGFARGPSSSSLHMLPVVDAKRGEGDLYRLSCRLQNESGVDHFLRGRVDDRSGKDVDRRMEEMGHQN